MGESVLTVIRRNGSVTVSCCCGSVSLGQTVETDFRSLWLVPAFVLGIAIGIAIGVLVGTLL